MPVPVGGSVRSERLAACLAATSRRPRYMGRGPLMCIAAGPASALASLAGGAREHDGRRAHRPGRGLRGAECPRWSGPCSPSGCASAWAQHARVVDQLAERFPAAAELLADAAADLLAFTAFPAETGARPGPTIPGAAEQRARRVCVPTGGLFLQRDHIGAWVEPLPALAQCHNQSGPA